MRSEIFRAARSKPQAGFMKHRLHPKAGAKKPDYMAEFEGCETDKSYLVYFTVPGMNQDGITGYCKSNPLIQKIKDHLTNKKIKAQFVDTVIHWGSPNQDWLEFKCDKVELDFVWHKPTCLSEIWNEIEIALNKGELLMVVC